jgi:predicted O-linked N-acetylglucosamine transferase (SPINDLY family)
MNWYPQAEELLLQENYQQLASFYEEAIDVDPDNVDNYWYLGLAYLLLGKEEEAQTTWFFPMGFGGEEEIQIWTENLVNILDTEAKRQELEKNNHLAWLIRGHLREVAPSLINNILHLIKLEIKLNRFIPTNLVNYNLIEYLEQNQINSANLNLLLEVIEQVILFPSSHTLAFIVASIKHFNEPQQLINIIMLAALKNTYQNNQPQFSISLANICLTIKSDNLYVIKDLIGFHLRAKDYTTALPAFSEQIAEKINRDQIDILIDVDSLTYNITCQVMALKPAPIQVTWLGMDATGLPTVDYFIADPYVLPENADNYYQEKIWRLPQTYLAVDGFEVGVSTLKRQDLDIPSDAITYFTGQSGMKRNPDTIRMQLKIIKEVTNSYLLIKGMADDSAIQELFSKLALEEGVSQDKLIFLQNVSCEEIHRANLQELADIVLDTYPYSGATTTLETLWLGIPIVTKVGQQWAARNSYAFMMNAGITEGIAWNDQEYIDWGIRLGKDENLRAKIAWKLRQSKKTAPLWNAKQFTLEMEKAYRQMWEIYCQNN